jgi:hypothetical protein
MFFMCGKSITFLKFFIINYFLILKMIKNTKKTKIYLSNFNPFIKYMHIFLIKKIIF